MTVESILCDKLGIRFVDARNLSVQAKVNLELTGYASKQQQGEVLQESFKLFENTVPSEEKECMRTIRKEMDSVLGRGHVGTGLRGNQEENTESELGISFRSDDLTTSSEASWRKRTKRLGMRLWTARKA